MVYFGLWRGLANVEVKVCTVMPHSSCEAHGDTTFVLSLGLPWRTKVGVCGLLTVGFCFG